MKKELFLLTAGVIMLSLTLNAGNSLGASVVVDADGGTKIDLQGMGISVTGGNVSIDGGGKKVKTKNKIDGSGDVQIKTSTVKGGNITNKVVSGNRTEIAIGPGSQAVAGGVSIVNGKVKTDNGTNDSGIEKVEQRRLGAYHAVEIKNFPGDVVLRAGKKNEVAVTADGAIISAISTTVENETLLIDLTRDISTSMPLNIELGIEQISSLVVSGVADVVIEGVSADTLHLEIAGSGSITAKGFVKTLDAAITGSGDLKLAGLKADQCTVKVDGQGDAAVHVTKTLIAEVNGSGDVVYSGNPANVSKEVNGLGDINPAGN